MTVANHNKNIKVVAKQSEQDRCETSCYITTSHTLTVCGGMQSKH